MSRQYKIENKQGELKAYPNPLAKYATYNYHQILVMCDSTSTAAALYNLDARNLENFAVSPDLEVLLSDLGPDEYPEWAIPIQNTKGETGRYVTISNSMTACKYSLNDVSWTSVIGETTRNNDLSFATTLSEEGELEIHELIGVSFYTAISNVVRSLKVDPSTIIMYLKTIFIGNPDHREDKVEYYDSRPLLFMMTNITSSFGIDGSHHKMTFVGVKNGFGHSPQIAQIGSDVKLKIPRDKTLLTKALTEFEISLNKRYDAYIKKISDLHKENHCEFNEENLRKVKYRIKVSPEYEGAEYLIDILDDWVSIDGDRVIFNFGSNATVESCIDHIMLRSKKVTTDVDATGNKRIYNIINNISSTKKEITVTYIIQMVTLIYDKPQPSPEEINNIKSKSIEFDYIFTGKNTDIEENGIEMQMDLGNAYFRYLTTHKALSSNHAESISTKDCIESKVVSSNITKNLVSNKGNKENPTTAFFCGSSMDHISRNSGNMGDTLSQRQILSNYAAISNIATSITIHGNPELIMGAIPENELDKPGIAHAEDFFNIPIWCKVNVKYPDSTFPEGDYRILDFWYQGYYKILKISHVFSGGLFKQTLNLISQPVASNVAEDGQTIKSECDFSKIQESAIEEINKTTEAPAPVVAPVVAPTEPEKPNTIPDLILSKATYTNNALGLGWLGAGTIQLAGTVAKGWSLIGDTLVEVITPDTTAPVPKTVNKAPIVHGPEELPKIDKPSTKVLIDKDPNNNKRFL